MCTYARCTNAQKNPSDITITVGATLSASTQKIEVKNKKQISSKFINPKCMYSTFLWQLSEKVVVENVWCLLGEI
jgi:hypothetical protein